MSLNKDRDTEAYVKQQLKLMETLTVEMDGRWLRGTIGGYEFFALVFQIGSRYGINEGRVSKLSVRPKSQSLTDGSRYIINYDRGWDIEPETEEHKLILDTLVELFENLPLEEIPLRRR